MDHTPPSRDTACMPPPGSTARTTAILMKVAAWPFRPPHPPITWTRTILWWELRRIPYNILVGFCAIVSLVVFFLAIAGSGALAPGEDAVEPLGLLAALILAPIAINICYTLGWIVELILRGISPTLSPHFGPILLAAGLAFSCLVVALPALFWLAMLALNGLSHLL